ncbi:MAG TPA: NUDIX domain-containing protein [Candidatus Dormibacteraeota bacterium]
MTHYCVNCGAELVARTVEGRQVEGCPHDDFVLWHDPKVTTAVVVEVDGGILVGRRAIEPGRGLWCLPGGFVNDDEDPWDAAARECMEEICAPVVMTRLIGVYHIAKRTAPSMIGIAYQAKLADQRRPSAGPEMLEVGVFALDSLPPMAFPSHLKVLDEYRAARSPAPAEAEGSRNAAAAAQRGRRPSPVPARPRPPRKQ